MDISLGGFAGRLDVIEGRSGRRRWSDEEKVRIAGESYRPGARVAEVARRHGTTRWQIYDWRRRLARGMLTPTNATASFAAVVVEAEVPNLEPPLATGPTTGATSTSEIVEIVIGGVLIRAPANADEAHLARVIRAARAAVA